VTDSLQHRSGRGIEHHHALFTRDFRSFTGTPPKRFFDSVDYCQAPAYGCGMVSERDVRRAALALPGAYEHTSYEGCPSWRTKPRMFTWIRQDPEALVVWVESLDAKEALLACEPKVFFTTPHYDGYAIVLVRLAAVDAARAKELITESWKLRAPKTLVKQAAAKPTKAPVAKGKKAATKASKR
jgi:hypothetical protein